MSLAADLLARLLHTMAECDRDPLERRLRHELRAEPALAALLPPVDAAPARVRAALARLHFEAIAARDDVAAAHAFLDASRVPPSFVTEVLAGRRQGLERWADVLARLLDDPAPLVRSRALDALKIAVERDGADLTAHAGALLRSAIDREKAGGTRLVATDARPVLAAAIAKTTDRARFVEAAGELLRDVDAAQEKDLRAVLRKTLPEAVAIRRAPRATPSTDQAGLLAAIDGAPDDDAARLVYADALLEAGDPRGELVVLQCERARSGAAPTARETALLRTHTRAWLGDAFGLFEPASIAFERGFLAAATLVGKGIHTRWPEEPVAALRHLERLHVTGASTDTYVLRSDVVPRLRAVTGIDHRIFRWIAHQDIEHAGFRTFDLETVAPFLALVYRRLRALTVPDSHLDALVRAGDLPANIVTIASARRRFVRAGTRWVKERDGGAR